MRRQDYTSLFFMPKPTTIMGRTSSITNAFVNGIIPCIMPSSEEIGEALNILGMDSDTVCCAYCGDRYTEWDHFRPLIVNKQPTGYISEIHNLVPCCGKCNQSKGNKYWKDWIKSQAPLSPQSRSISDLELRIHRLERFEAWGEPIQVDFEKILGEDLWNEHWRNYEELMDKMKESQKVSDKIRKAIQGAVLSEE